MAGVKLFFWFFFYLSGPLLGELFGQVSADASSTAGDQHHLPAQILPPARQQGRQTGSDQIIEHLDREEEHTTRALQLHVGGALSVSSRQKQEKCLRCKFSLLRARRGRYPPKHSDPGAPASLSACKQQQAAHVQLHKLLHG